MIAAQTPFAFVARENRFSGSCSKSQILLSDQDDFRFSEKVLDRHPKSVVSCQPSRLDKRGVRVVTNVGRDAVDVEVPLTSGARCGRRNRVVLTS